MALVRRLLGDAQAKIRKMVDENLQNNGRPDSLDRPEPADPLITPATDANTSHTISDTICRPGGSPSRPHMSKIYSNNYDHIDKKTSLALDRKINFEKARNGNLNGSASEATYESIPGTSKGARLSLSNRQSSRTSFAERSSCSAINEIENENVNDGFEDSEPEVGHNGDVESPHQQNGGSAESRASYAEIVVPVSGKYSDRNSVLNADSSDADDDVAPSDNGSGTSPRATDTGPQDNDDTSGRSGSGRDSRGGLECARSTDALLPASPRPLTGAEASRRLRHENERLRGEVARLRRLVVATAEKGQAGTALLQDGVQEDGDDTTANGETPSVPVLQSELKMAREAIIALKADKKRLKAEKFDLLNQMKQLYASLEDKERELRDFIRNYEQMREEEGFRRRSGGMQDDHERHILLRRARDEAERCLALAARLSARELQLQHARDQLQEARRQLQAGGWVSDQESLGSLPRTQGGALTPGGSAPSTGLPLAPGDRGSCSADSGVRVTGSSDRESAATSVGGNLSDSTTDGTPTITLGEGLDMDSISVVSSVQHQPHHMYHGGPPKDCSPTMSPHNMNAFSRSMDNSVLSRSVEHLSGVGEREVVAIPRNRGRQGAAGGGGTLASTTRSGRAPSAWGSISRVFARSRHRSKIPTSNLHDCDDSFAESLYECGGGSWAEAALREAASLPMERWRAPAVRAWLDLALGMPPQYGARCADNIKSGKVLLELTDAELESELGIAHPMHRKKVRLAIEEQRHPDMVRYPTIGQLNHEWVATEWLQDLGLSQYGESFAANMVDARMLDNLSKKELEKYLGVTRKFHQASIVHGIHLLRLMKYDRQALALRRHQCEAVDADPLVWTNQRFVRWARNIDLAEYADNLKDSGVHGGLVVLEPSFTGDTMATALGVPPARAIIRRHLSQQLDALVLPARSSLGAIPSRRCRLPPPNVPAPPPPRNHWRSLAGLEAADFSAKNIKGSITRALGLKSKQDKTSPSSSSESSSIISRFSNKPSPPRTRSHLNIGYPSTGGGQQSFSSYDYDSGHSTYDSPVNYNINSLPYRVSSQQSINSNIYSNGSICFDISELDTVPQQTYSQRSINSHRVSSPLPIQEESDGSYKQNKHRRVKSISDIEAAAAT